MRDQDAPRRHWLPQGLPVLTGPAWWIFLVFCTLAAGLSAWGFGQAALGEFKGKPRAETLYGFQMKSPMDTGNAVDGRTVLFPVGREATQAGIRAGDQVISVDGRALGDGVFPVMDLLDALDRPATATFVMLSADGRRATHRLTRDRAHIEEALAPVGFSYTGRRMTARFIQILLLGAAPLILAVLLLIRRARDPLAPWVALLAVMLPLAPSLAGDWYLAQENGWAWIGAIASPLVGWLSIALLALYPTARFAPRWTWPVVIGSLPLMWFMRVDATPFSFNAALLAGSFAAVAVVVARYRAMPLGPGRQQIRWSLFGLFASVAILPILLVEQRLLQHVPSAVEWTWLILADTLLAAIATILPVAAMTLGLMRYRLYDADATISRSVAYGALSVVLIAVFIAAEKVVDTISQDYLGERLGGMAGAIGAALAAAMVAPLHGHVMGWTEKRFRGGLVGLRAKLPALVGDMRETATPGKLAETVLRHCEAGVRAKHGAVVVGTEIVETRGIEAAAVRTWLAQGEAPTEGLDMLHSDRADPLLPMRVPLHVEEIGLVGWLLLGPRPDGSFYGRDERDALAEIADPVARALAIAIERERRQVEGARRVKGLEREVSGLRRLVNRLQARLGPDAAPVPQGS